MPTATLINLIGPSLYRVVFNKNSFELPLTRPKTLKGTLIMATGNLRAVYARNWVAYTDGTKWNNWCDDPLVLAVAECPGEEWTEISCTAGFISNTKAPRIAVCGTGAQYASAIPLKAWVHRDDTVGINLTSSNGEDLKGRYSVSPDFGGGMISLTQSSKLDRNVIDGAGGRFVVKAMAKLSPDDLSSIGYVRIEDSRDNSFVDKPYTKFISESSMAIGPSFDTAVKNGIEPKFIGCDVGFDGVIHCDDFVVTDPHCAAVAFSQPWLIGLKPGTRVCELIDAGSRFISRDVVCLPVEALSSGGITVKDHVEIIAKTPKGPSEISVSGQNLTLEKSAEPFLFSTSPVRHYLVSRSSLPTFFVPLVEACRRLIVPEAACVRVSAAGSSKEIEGKYVLRSETAQMPHRGTEIRNRNQIARRREEEVFQKYGRSIEGFDGKTHTPEDAALHLEIERRLIEGTLFSLENAMSEVVATPFNPKLQSELVGLPGSLKDPITGTRYYPKKYRLEEELAARPKELFEKACPGISGVLARFISSEDAMRSFRISVITGA